MLCAALNVNSMLWKTSPAATELEHRTLDWLRRMVGLPPAFWGILYDTASISTLHGIAAARERVERGDIRKRGMAGRIDLPVLRLYASENAHSSVDKAAITLGIGLDNLCKVRVDASQRMDVEDLRLQMAEDRAAGRMPFCVVATIGTTSTTAVDPVRSIASLCRAEACWLHVDAAYAGPAAALPEMRPHFDGWEEADSIVLNPHKWLFTPIDCSAFYTRHPDVLKQAFSLVPEYLKTSDSAENLMDFGIQLGRRFRALKLWFVLRTFGQQGIRDRLREHVRLARRFAEWVDKHPDFERLAEAPYSVVCFRARPAWAADEELDGLNARLLDAVNATGECFLSHTRVNGRFSLRLAVGNLRTEERHVRRAWEILEEKIRSMHPEE
jgi:aromatic-L-amino-acid decarboxylase